MAAIAGACVLCSAPLAIPQGPSSPISTPKFEVASVKLCTAGNTGSAPAAGGGGVGAARGGRGDTSSPGRMDLPCLSLKTLIQISYLDFADGKYLPASDVRIEGGPSWMTSDFYRIIAKPESAVTEGMMRGPMLQRLLEDRFQLKLHRQSREVPLYALTTAKGGSKLQPATPGNCVPRDPNAPPAFPDPGAKPWCGVTLRVTVGSGKVAMEGVGAGVPELARRLGSRLDRPVVDHTGLTGTFDFHLQFTTDTTTPADDSPLSSVFDALASLGLKLEQVRGPRDFLVIDRVERPTEN